VYFLRLLYGVDEATMAHECIYFPGGVLRVPLDSKLKDRLAKLVHQRFGKEGGERISRVLEAVVGHRYFVKDRWAAALQREHTDRYRHCQELLQSFLSLLEQGEIRQEGLEGKTGQPELTPQKLRGRPIRLLDPGPDLLLIQVERHPMGSAAHVQVMQYWLYLRRARMVRLLHDQTEGTPDPIRIVVRRRNENWCEPSSELRDGFHAFVVQVFGPGWKERFECLVAFQAHLLADRPSEVVIATKQITGIDIDAAEAARFKDWETATLKRLKTRREEEADYTWSVDHQAGIHLVYAPGHGKELRRLG
jgi:hypothetical protein